jgi:Fe-S cluster biogenesis protein NfuA/nitrite reductase/ring-hydroxylating ferredoxin subunit
LEDQEVSERVGRVEALIEQVESLPDRVAREAAMEMVGALLDLYGEGLSRTLAPLNDETRRAVANDELVAHLLLLHDLHPVPVETRVHEALEEVRPYLDSHGGGVELVAVEEGVVRLRMHGSCDGCPSSSMTLKLAIEDAIHKAAPDVEDVVAEGTPKPAPGLLQIEMPSWADAGAIADLPADAPTVMAAGGHELVFVRLGRAAYAYDRVCGGCGADLSGATLDGAILTCASCGGGFDVRHAGRRVDDDDEHLEPVPLLVGEDGRMRVAVR